MTYIASTLKPHGNYPTHDSEFGLGGYREVECQGDLNKIPIERLKIGSLVYVAENDTIYKWNGTEFVATELLVTTEQIIDELKETEVISQHTLFKNLYSLNKIEERDKPTPENLNGWTSQYPTEQSGKYVWVAFVYKNNTGQYVKPETWTYARLTGKDGKNGEDGETTEYIYKLTQSNSRPDTPSSKQQRDYIPIGWTDNPTGISEQYKYEWMCLRLRTTNGWGNFTDPVLWAKWGDKGTDGDGVEYIFSTLFDPDNMDTAHLDDPSTWAASQEDDYILPARRDFWFDNPSTDSDKTIEYVSLRKKKNGLWQQFCEPAIWYKAGSNISSEMATQVILEHADDLVAAIQDKGELAELVLEGDTAILRAGTDGAIETSGGQVLIEPHATTILNTTLDKMGSQQTTAGAAFLTDKHGAGASLQAIYEEHANEPGVGNPIVASITAIANSVGSTIELNADTVSILAQTLMAQGADVLAKSFKTVQEENKFSIQITENGTIEFYFGINTPAYTDPVARFYMDDEDFCLAIKSNGELKKINFSTLLESLNSLPMDTEPYYSIDISDAGSSEPPTGGGSFGGSNHAPEIASAVGYITSNQNYFYYFLDNGQRVYYRDPNKSIILNGEYFIKASTIDYPLFIKFNYNNITGYLSIPTNSNNQVTIYKLVTFTNGIKEITDQYIIIGPKFLYRKNFNASNFSEPIMYTNANMVYTIKSETIDTIPVYYQTTISSRGKLSWTPYDLGDSIVNPTTNYISETWQGDLYTGSKSVTTIISGRQTTEIISV